MRAALILADSSFLPAADRSGPGPDGPVERLEESIRVTCRAGSSRCDAAALGPSGWRLDPPNRAPPAAPANASWGVRAGPVASEVFLKHCTALLAAAFLPPPGRESEPVQPQPRPARPHPLLSHPPPPLCPPPPAAAEPPPPARTRPLPPPAPPRLPHQ